MVHAWLIDQWFGPVPVAFGLSSLFLHWINCLLIAALGCWKAIGWRVSVPAAAFFAVFEGPQEAVIWFAASPELHVFAFLLGGILCWIRRWTVASLACFVLALLSKESGVILPGLLALVLIAERDFRPKRWLALLPFCVIAIGYFVAGYIHRGDHLHYNDGTFALHAPFWITLPRSIARMTWLWGLGALAILRLWRPALLLPAALLATGWMVVGLLPYSFLTYMTRVPSRHTYIAAAGLALLVGLAARVFWEEAHTSNRRAIAATAAAILLIGNAGYLWTRKHQQYVERARPTEDLVQRLTQSSEEPVTLCGFPYSDNIAESVLLVSGQPLERLQRCSEN